MIYTLLSTGTQYRYNYEKSSQWLSFVNSINLGLYTHHLVFDIMPDITDNCIGR